MNGWLIDTFLYTGLLIAGVLLLRRPVGRYLGPQFAYALWALPFLRLLLPPIVLPASLRPAPEPAVTAAASGEWLAPAPAASFPFEPSAAPAETLPAASAGYWPGLAEIALSVWIGGALAFLAWRIVTYQRMRRELLAEARPVGEAGRIRLIETPALAAPVAFGVIDKVIALPPLFMAQPDIVARDLAIAHELAHHRGHDLSANFAAQALLALHWFNPLAWLGWRAMRRDQEAACDARVLAGKGREDRIRYAALIAGAAAGRRLALDAPMACPMLGDKSIIHRLRSLARAETSARRRWLGRGLVAAGAFALPLTASISYAEIPEPPLPPAAPEAPAQATSPVAPEADQAVAGDFVLRGERDGEVAPRSEPASSSRQSGAVPPAPPAVRFEFPWGEPDDPDFAEKMEAWGREMEQWGEEYGRQMERWGEAWGETYGAQAQAQAVAQAHRAEALAEAHARRAEGEARHAQSLAGAQARRAQAEARQSVRSSLRAARDSIAQNADISEEVRREVLADLEEELERIEHDQE